MTGALLQDAVERFGFQSDAFIHELVDAIIGDNYPVPDRMLVHAEQVVHEYLIQAMCGMPRPPGRFDLFATEGGTAAICYIFRSLKANRLLKPGDRIALGTPIFTPYLEIPQLEDYGLEPVYVDAPQENGFQFTDAELAKLEDPRVKAFFLVNPGNPTSVAISPAVRTSIANLVRTRRPDLMLITDDVYATFVDDFRSLMGELPHNTIGVYSYSKYFGCTGWRLGVIAIHQDNLFDEKLAALPETERQALDQRYGMLALEPRKLRFIDRLVADSRDVALNHTAGLSPPQQAMMTLFSLVELADHERTYRQECTAILRRRVTALLDGLGLAGDARAAVRQLLRPDQPGILAAQIPRRRRRAVHQAECPSARHRVPTGTRLRHRAAQRWRVSCARLVGARVIREPGRRCLRRHRPRDPSHRAGLRACVPRGTTGRQHASGARTGLAKGVDAMSDDRSVLDAVRSALHSEPRVHPTEGPIHLAFVDGDLTMEGEVDHIAGKKLALEAAARVPGVANIVDRLRVRPATPMGDGEIRDKVRDALLEEITLECMHDPGLGPGTTGDGARTGRCRRHDRRPRRGRHRHVGWRRCGPRSEAYGRCACLVGARQPRRDQWHRCHAAGAGQRSRGHRCRASGAGEGSVHQFGKHSGAHAAEPW